MDPVDRPTTSNPPAGGAPRRDAGVRGGTAPAGTALTGVEAAQPVDRIVTSLAVVVAGLDRAGAARLLARVGISVPPGTRVEYLVLDDHGDPTRRDVLDVVDTALRTGSGAHGGSHEDQADAAAGVGEASRRVARPAGGRAAELDALSAAAQSEFLVLPDAEGRLAPALDSALSALWVQGADAVTVVQSADDVGDGDDGELLARHLGLSGPPADRLVVIRRWVARWVLTEIERAVDPAEELADRARLLGLGLVVVDAMGAPVT